VGVELQDEDLTGRIIGAAMRVHTALGPGLLESVYEACLAHELAAIALGVQRQVELPVEYGGIRIDAGFRIDLLVDRRVVVELKAVERVLPIHEAQLLTYLRLSGLHTGLLLNFNVTRLTDGITRRVLRPKP
jgi:GxxExxY protein